MVVLEYKYAQNLELNNDSPICILIFHGLSGTPFEMKHLAESFSKRGYDVFVPIIPYHGMSFDHLLQLNDPTELYEWGKELIFQKKQEYDKLIVLGFSLGAGMTFVAETSNPTADAYIGISTGGIFSWMLRLFSFVYRFIKIKSIPFSLPSNYDKSLVDNDYLEWKMENMNRMPMSVLVHAVRQSKHLKKVVKKLVTPVLIINGVNDLTTSKKATTYVVKNASSKIRKGFLVKDGGHLLLNTGFFEIIFEEIITFIHQILENNQIEVEYLGELSLN